MKVDKELKEVYWKKVRDVGKKLIGAAAVGLFMGGAVQAGLSDVDQPSGDKLVDQISDQVDGDSPGETDLVSEEVNRSESSDSIEYHRLSC